MSGDATSSLVVVGIVAAIGNAAFFDREVYPAEWNHATELCTIANSTINYIEISSIWIDVYCENGATFNARAAGFSGKYQTEETKK